MRIIAGKYRGTIIPSPKESVVKPTLDRIKENVFNILQFKIDGAICLDLFCGSGALGLECLSRNAGEVTFVDNNKQNILALQKFLEKLKAENYNLRNEDFYESLKFFECQNKQFDLIFLDPPFDSNLAEVALQKIFKFNLLKQKGIVVWEHHTDTITDKFKLKIKDTRKYGTVQIDFISR